MVPPQGNEYSNVDFVITEETIPVRSLLTIEGIRFIFTSFVANFQNFGVIAVVFIAMMGAGVAEGAGLLNTLIRKLVAVAPRRIITFLIILVGGLSSIATDAGYLILIPLAASAFLGLRRTSRWRVLRRDSPVSGRRSASTSSSSRPTRCSPRSPTRRSG